VTRYTASYLEDSTVLEIPALFQHRKDRWGKMVPLSKPCFRYYRELFSDGSKILGTIRDHDNGLLHGRSSDIGWSIVQGRCVELAGACHTEQRGSRGVFGCDLTKGEIGEVLNSPS